MTSVYRYCEGGGLEDVFKHNYIDYVFSLLPTLERHWECQVLYLRQMWDTVGKLIPRQEFLKGFCKECVELNLLPHTFDMDSAFEYAKVDVGLMLAVATQIICFHDQDVPLDIPVNELVQMKDGCILVNSNICKRFAKYGHLWVEQ